MKRNILFILCFIVFITNSYALNTYVGVKITNMTDRPGYSCAGEVTQDPHGNMASYDYRGRIRAISSIVGPEHAAEYPIHFKITRTSDSALIWEGDSTEDVDYDIGKTIMVPALIDLTIGTEYTFFMDYDAVRLYVPSLDAEDFYAKPDQNYWTVGAKGAGTALEYRMYSYSGDCNARGIHGREQRYMVFFSGNRSLLEDSCMTDAISFNCDEKHIIGWSNQYAGCCDRNFNMPWPPYNYLDPALGNIEFTFTP